MKRYHVIGKSYDQARAWCDRHFDPDIKYVPISDPVQLRGFTNPKGRFIGQWYDNPQIVQILTVLISSTFDKNEGLDQAIKYYHDLNNI